MKILLIILSGVLLVSNEPNKAQFEAITGTKVVKQGIVPVVAKKENSKAKTTKKAKKKKTTKNTKRNTKRNTKKKVVKKKTTKKTYRQTTKKTYNRNEIQNYVYNLMLQKGWNESEWYALNQIVIHESSWNPYSVNKKSGACGLFQAYKCSKMKNYGSDYKTNYKVQANWGLDYIKARYGSPSQAWSFWQKHHWF